MGLQKQEQQLQQHKMKMRSVSRTMLPTETTLRTSQNAKSQPHLLPYLRMLRYSAWTKKQQERFASMRRRNVQEISAACCEPWSTEKQPRISLNRQRRAA